MGRPTVLHVLAALCASRTAAWAQDAPRPQVALAWSAPSECPTRADVLALVSQVLGEPATPAIPAPSPSGVSLSPSGARTPSEPPGPVTAGDPRQAPLRHLAHPYDALIAAGSEPADVYVVDLGALEAEHVKPDHYLEALHRASPQATFIALSDQHVELPRFAHCIGRSDAHSLEAILSPEGAAASEPPPPAELPRAVGATR